MLEDAKDMICNQMGVKIVVSHSRYLYLWYLEDPKRKFFPFVVWKKMKGWKEKFLFKVGKEVLIKVVAQAIQVKL